VPVALFRRSHRGAKVRTTGARLLPEAPFGAHRQLLALIGEGRPSRVQEISATALADRDHERREARA
jgi:hypothetical protein